MTADKPLPLVPKLRFPEFRDAPEWEPRQLREVLDYEQPGKYLVEDTNYQDTGTPVLTANKGFVLGYTADSDGIYDNVPAIIFDDFTTDTKYVDFAFKVKSSAIKILTSRRDDELKFLFELMSRIRFDPTQHKRYYISLYQNWEIPLPNRAEQKKIADCLGSLDELIVAEKWKLETLRQHKQGLMQQLFPQPGETLPRLRFPEFRDASEWSLPTLQQLLKIPATYGIVKAGEYLSAGVPMIRGGDIKDGKVSVDLPLVAPEIHEQFKRTRLLRNDVVVALVGYPGEAAVIPDALVGANVSRAVGLLRVAPSLNPNYLAAYLNSSSGRKSFLKSSAGSAQVVVNLSDLNALQLPMPEIDEQGRIACCIDTLNAHFGAQSLKINALKQHKQGLLQQLFPSLEQGLI